MSKGAIIFSDNNEYYTPKNLVNMFGKFDYDPATTVEKAEDLGIKNYDTAETDGLTTEWGGYNNIWINPPFTLKHLFFEKACKTYAEFKNNIFILVPIEFLTTKRFHKACAKHGVGVKIFIPNGRIKFESELGKPAKSPAFGCVILNLSEQFECKLLSLE